MGNPRKTPAEKAITAALAAYRTADAATGRAFAAFEQACERAREEALASPTFIITGPPEPVRKAFLVAEARALEAIAEAARQKALQARRNI